MKKLTIALVSVMGFLGGCGAAPDGADDASYEEAVAEEDAALTSSPFTLKNYQTGLCLGVKGGNPTPGTQLIVWHCDGSTNQRWTKGPADKYGYLPLGNGVAPNRCLATANGTNGSLAKIESCSSLNTWRPIYAGTDLWGKECYRFAKNGTQTKVIGVSGGSTSVGAGVILWDDFADPFGHPDQLWCVH